MSSKLPTQIHTTKWNSHWYVIKYGVGCANTHTHTHTQTHTPRHSKTHTITHREEEIEGERERNIHKFIHMEHIKIQRKRYGHKYPYTLTLEWNGNPGTRQCLFLVVCLSFFFFSYCLLWFYYDFCVDFAFIAIQCEYFVVVIIIVFVVVVVAAVIMIVVIHSFCTNSAKITKPHKMRLDQQKYKTKQCREPRHTTQEALN